MYWRRGGSCRVTSTCARRMTSTCATNVATPTIATLLLQDFEPYVLAAREKLPPYDERLRGYFENKAVHLRHMATSGCASFTWLKINRESVDFRLTCKWLLREQDRAPATHGRLRVRFFPLVEDNIRTAWLLLKLQVAASRTRLCATAPHARLRACAPGMLQASSRRPPAILPAVTRRRACLEQSIRPQVLGKTWGAIATGALIC